METYLLPMEELAKILEVQLENDGLAPLTVSGISMLPMLHHYKDSVILQRLHRKPRVGDLPLYRREDGSYILHRVIRIVDEDTCICCGDNQWEKETVKNSQILAVTVAFRRNGTQYSVQHRGYRFYVWLWVALHPVRRPMLWVRRQLGKLRRKLR